MLEIKRLNNKTGQQHSIEMEFMGLNHYFRRFGTAEKIR